MDPLLKRLELVGAGVGALIAALGAGVYWQLFRRPMPRTEGRLRVAGAAGPVEIRRDRWGVPHVRAGSLDDAWFGQGFCHGQDRLWQLDLYRRFSSGRLAEIAGGHGLAADRFMRTLGLRRIALLEEAALEGELRTALESYSAGVNAAAEAAAALPAELQILRQRFEPWRPADTLTLTKLLALGLSTNWERELLRADMTRELGPELAARLDPSYPAGNPVALEPGMPWSGDGLALAEQIDRVRETLGLAPEATGSNNWAVSPVRSATGGALLAGDPHLTQRMPGITYQLGIEVAGRSCRGASFPGRVGIVFGQNDDVAWSLTNTMADVMDLYVERVEGEEYEFRGERLPLVTTEETIAVRGREPEQLVVRATHHGPIVNDALGADPDEPLALRWSALEGPCVTEASLGVLRVTSGPELVASLAPHVAPVSNLVWADRHGSIGYKAIGRVPLRRGDCPDLPKPGWSGDFEWDGWVPYDEMPELVDPEQGYVLTANNRITPADYPHHITSDWLDGYRARRIEDLLAADDEHDLDRFQAMQTDMLSIPGLETARRLARLRPRDQRETAAIERLRSWDGRMGPDSVAATIYQAFTMQVRARRRPRGDRRPRPRRALARPRRQRVPQARHLALALALAPARALGGGRRGADRARLGRARARLAAGGAFRARRALRRRPGRLALGLGARARVRAPARRRESRLRSDLQPPARGRRRRGDGRPGRLGPERPLPRDLGPGLADRRRPGRPLALALAGVHRPVRACRQRPLRRPAAALGGGGDAGDGRRGAVAHAHARARQRTVSRRDQITLSAAEQAELLESERVVVVSSLGPRGWPHSMPMWFTVRDGEIWVWTYAKSQKVRNLERDPRATLLVEAGSEYTELRGVQIEAEAELIRDPEGVLEFGKELTIRYAEGIDSIEGDAAAALQAQASKRVAIRFRAAPGRDLGPPQARRHVLISAHRRHPWRSSLPARWKRSRA